MTVNSCGTGDWNGPKPGDPDTTNLILTATPAFGGIDVNWTFPLLNPEAVAYTMLYRSLTSNPDSKSLIANVGGSFYYDKTTISVNTLYYYWIQVVSVNGTVGDLIGPAWARARPLIGQLIEELTGQIDAGMLAQSLKAPIDQIKLNTLAITQEQLDRDAADDTYGVLISEIKGQLDNNRAILQQEVQARVTADQSFVTSVNTLYANFNTSLSQSIAAVQTVTTALAQADKSLASQITTVQSQLGKDISSVQVTLSTSLNLLGQQVTNIGALWTAQVNVNGLIGGFGVYSDGKSVEAGFDVDRFWIGRTGANKRKPFIVQDGQVFIDQAVIYSLTFSKLRDETGAFIVQNGRVSAQYIDAVNLAVEWAKIKNVSIGTADIQDAAVTNAKIQNLSVDTLKIAGNAVTIPVGAFAGSNTVSVTVTFDGDYAVFVQGSCTTSYTAALTLKRNGATLWSELPAGNSLSSRGIMDHPGPGTHTYTLASADSRNTNGSSIIVLVCKK